MGKPVGLGDTVATGIKKMMNAKTIKHYCLSFVGFVIFPLISLSCAEASIVSEQVERYCKLDYQGARVLKGQYADLRSLMAWEEDQDEPGWDCFKIISGYKILNETISGDTATVSVKILNTANLCGGGLLEREEGTDTIKVHLVKTGKKWKLKEYIPYPRISVDTATQFLKERKLMYQNNSEDINVLKINNVLEQLKTINRNQ